MATLLNIDASGSSSFVTLAINGRVAGVRINETTKDHAVFLHPAIKELLNDSKLKTTDLDGIAVVAGPGSYTGIRVAMASAKGLCLALHKPFLTVNMLKLMAFDAHMHVTETDAVFCPMIDARRMEVFMAVYDGSLKEIVSARALILDENVLSFPQNKPVYIFGSGAIKSRSVVNFRNCTFIENVNLPVSMSMLTHDMYHQKLFTSLINSEPLYVKEFHNNV